MVARVWYGMVWYGMVWYGKAEARAGEVTRLPGGGIKNENPTSGGLGTKMIPSKHPNSEANRIDADGPTRGTEAKCHGRAWYHCLDLDLGLDLDLDLDL